MTRQVKRYGWVPDLPDQRDHLYAAPATGARRACRRAWTCARSARRSTTRAQLGSCTAQRHRRRDRVRPDEAAGSTDFTPSRLFIYYNERVIEGTVDATAARMIRDGIKSVAQAGRLPGDAVALRHRQVRRASRRPTCYTDGREAPGASAISGCPDARAR